MNLRGEYRPVILDYIRKTHPDLSELYEEIYVDGILSWWFSLNEEIKEFCKTEKLDYVRNDDSMQRPFTAPPVVVNYFFHDEVKKKSTKTNSIS